MPPRRPRPFPIFVLPLALALPACADAGVEAALDAPALTAIEVLRIGSIDDPETTLTYIGEMVVDSRERIYSAHPQEQVIRLHGPEGELVRELGGDGEGPGEFRAIGVIGRRGDTLWAFDYRLYRVSWFGPDGELVRMQTIPVDYGDDPRNQPPRPDGLLPDGRIFGSPPAWAHDIALGNITETPVVVLDSTGAVGDTLFFHPHSIWAVMDPDDPRAFGSFRSQPFAEETIVEIFPLDTSYALAERAVRPETGPHTFRVARVTFGGDTLFDRTYAYEPRPIDPALPDSLARDWGATFEERRFPGAPTAAKAAEWARSTLEVPPHHPPISAMALGRDGSIWLQRERVDPARSTWLVLDGDDGDVLGQVRFPARFDPHVVQADRVWGSLRDELDVPYIVSYRIAEPAAGD